MEDKGLDMAKLLELQAFFDNNFEKIKTQVEKQLLMFGEKLRRNFDITPDPQDFYNWLLDNYSTEILKKRRVPFKLKDDYILEFCLAYCEELNHKILKQKHNLVFSKKDNENQPHWEEILKLLNELFENNITEELFSEILCETSDILHNGQIKHFYNPIPQNKLNTKLGSLRFCFYQIYLINGTKPVRYNLIEYLHTKFECFARTESTTTDKKFSERPKLYPR